MKITLGTIAHIKQLAVSREDGGLSDTERVELFDSIDCLDSDELSELYAIVKVGQCRAVAQYAAEVAKDRGREAGAAEHIFGLRELGTFLIAGTADLQLG